MRLGIHCAVIHGYAGALAEARAAGCETMQMLPYRRHHDPSPEETAVFQKAWRAGGVRSLVVHSRFVPSLASGDETRRARSVELLARELELARQLGGESFILHAGAYAPGSGAEEGMRLAAGSIVKAWESSGCGLPVLIENVPGGGRRMGALLEELARLLELVGKRIPGLGVCLDTAHAWAAGYDLSSAEGMLRFLARVNRLLGADRVKVFHLNETRALLGSRKEQHWHWGEGFIGAEALRTLLARPDYSGAAGIVENPKTEGADLRNLEFVRRAAA